MDFNDSMGILFDLIQVLEAASFSRELKELLPVNIFKFWGIKKIIRKELSLKNALVYITL